VNVCERSNPIDLNEKASAPVILLYRKRLIMIDKQALTNGFWFVVCPVYDETWIN
jgi:hypothetical protein